jgi:hypothetical protein
MTRNRVVVPRRYSRVRLAGSRSESARKTMNARPNGKTVRLNSTPTASEAPASASNARRSANSRMAATTIVRLAYGSVM